MAKPKTVGFVGKPEKWAITTSVNMYHCDTLDKNRRKRAAAFLRDIARTLENPTPEQLKKLRTGKRSYFHEILRVK